MRRAARVDTNQPDIVRALQKIGCDVEVIGRPVDLLVGYRAKNFLIEVKNPNGENKVYDGQKDFISRWRGQVRVVRSADEAIRLVTGAYADS
jgi:hypothetical protein